ncbi:MAG: mechanosensitive ion channel family protein [Phycisphaerales bacterium]
MNFDKVIAHFEAALIPLAVLVGTVLIGYIIRTIIFARVSKWSETKYGLTKKVIQIIRGPVIVWFLMLGIYLGLQMSVVPKDVVAVIGKILLALGIFSITLVCVNLATSLIAKHSLMIEGVMPIASLTQNIARIIIFSIGFLIILNTFVPIGPILATLGVGGLAVALALQDTLSNIFSGFYIIISKQLRIGDYVKLDSGEEGYITDITWRATQIKALPNNVILIPNEKLTKAICTNYNLPDKEISVGVNVGVHYNSDLDTVERVTVEVARQVMNEVKGGIPGFEPAVRFHTFNNSSIDFSVGLRAKEFTDQYLLKHEFIKRLVKRYNQENIVMPYPIVAINYSQEQSNPAEKSN